MKPGMTAARKTRPAPSELRPYRWLSRMVWAVSRTPPEKKPECQSQWIRITHGGGGAHQRSKSRP